MRPKVKIKRIVPAILILLTLLTACNNSPKNNSNENSNTKTKRSADTKVYQCSMHPHILKDEAGNCPVCSMELEQKSYHDALMYLSNYKKEHPDYKGDDDLLKDIKMRTKDRHNVNHVLN